MQLKDNWKHIVKKAWSIRLIAVAGVLSGAEVIIPLFQDTVPRGTFAILSFVATAGAFVARLVVQQEVGE